jgi:hypothetical protein
VALSRQNNSLNSADPLLDAAPSVQRLPLDEEIFRRMIAVERKRTERSKSPFLLMLLDVVSAGDPKKDRQTLDRIASALLLSSRDTDLIGWYKDKSIVGAMFTGLVIHDKRSMLDTFLTKVTSALREELTPEQFNQVSISFHLFPDDWDHDKPGRPSNAALYPDLVSHDEGKRALLLIKRLIDVMGSATLLILCAPLFAVIDRKIQSDSHGCDAQSKENLGQAETDPKQNEQGPLVCRRLLIEGDRMGNRGKNQRPGQNQHSPHAPNRPDIFPLPLLRVFCRRGEASVQNSGNDN